MIPKTLAECTVYQYLGTPRLSLSCFSNDPASSRRSHCAINVDGTRKSLYFIYIIAHSHVIDVSRPVIKVHTRVCCLRFCELNLEGKLIIEKHSVIVPDYY